MSDTYWNTEVRVNGVCKISSGDSSLSKALTAAIQSCVYYQAVYPGSTIAITSISEACARCHNEKTIIRQRSWRTIHHRCPECNGNGASGRLDDISFTMPDQWGMGAANV